MERMSNNRMVFYTYRRCLVVDSTLIIVREKLVLWAHFVRFVSKGPTFVRVLLCL